MIRIFYGSDTDTVYIGDRDTASLNELVATNNGNLVDIYSNKRGIYLIKGIKFERIGNVVGDGFPDVNTCVVYLNNEFNGTLPGVLTGFETVALINATLGNTDWQQTNTGPQGDPGVDGEGFTDAIINSNGELVLTKSDTSLLNVGLVKGPQGDQGIQGPQGPQGDDGREISSALIDQNGYLILTRSDNSTINAGDARGEIGPQGIQGNPGPMGMDGQDGSFMQYITIDELGQLIVTMSDSVVHNVGVVTGATGATGPQGVGVSSAVIDQEGDLIFTLTDTSTINAGSVNGNFQAQLDELEAKLLMQYDRLIHDAGDIMFIGEAEPGTGESEPKWRIQKFTTVPGQPVELTSGKWASGNADFIHSWTDRLTYTY